MNKTLTALVVLMALLAVLCSACGGSGANAADAAEPTPFVITTSEPTQATTVPAVTTEPQDAETVDTTEDEEVIFVSEDHRIAAGLEGESVEVLFEAIGEPQSSTYGASCLVEGAEDGQLAYDGFTVSTLRETDGTETVMGTW